jgi:hypothetical protein
MATTTSEFFRSASLTLPQQIGRMARTYPGFRARFRHGMVSWTGELQPSGAAETYSVKIDYRLRVRPKIWIRNPKLRRRDPSVRIPHTFMDGSVCLHLYEDWTPQMHIAETIVPWLALWLLHYEAWHAAGEWLGGGHEPTTKK